MDDDAGADDAIADDAGADDAGAYDAGAYDAGAYDKGNIFARILRGEIPCDKVFEDEHVLAFNDVNPQTAVHILVIPKGAYVSWDDFAARASDAEITALIRAVGRIATDKGLIAAGYRTLVNNGAHANQEVAHLHIHIFAGQPLGRMMKPPQKT
jgi:diadenosine tetraphosphate (Ap4A) HIT family hydrolase